LAGRKARGATKRPSTIKSALGPVAVRYVDEIRDSKGKKVDGVIGYFMGDMREIQVKNGLHPTQEAHTLQHEFIHLALWDSGVSQSLTKEQEEAVCDAVATALVASCQ
jgi:hypothetical protein